MLFHFFCRAKFLVKRNNIVAKARLKPEWPYTEHFSNGPSTTWYVAHEKTQLSLSGKPSCSQNSAMFLKFIFEHAIQDSEELYNFTPVLFIPLAILSYIWRAFFPVPFLDWHMPIFSIVCHDVRLSFTRNTHF